MPAVSTRLSADAGSVAVAVDGTVVASGLLHPVRGGWEVLVTPLDPSVEHDPEALAALVAKLVAIAPGTAPSQGGRTVRWLVSAPTEAHDEAAERAGLAGRRDLVQLRRVLPVDAAARAGVVVPPTRPFQPGRDEDAWLAVNNRSFADHPDQSAQTRSDLAALEAAPWFDADGFRLLDADGAGPRPGTLDGFCWTKVHRDHDPVLGEIFVIGVDPSAGGRGLGPGLTLAGLDHLAAAGITVGMLYVDVANERAVRMYDRLGFTTHHLDRIYLSNPT